MTVIFTTPCNSTADWTSVGGSTTITASGHTGNGLSVGGAGGANYSIPTANRSRKINASFWWRTSSIGVAHNIVSWRNGGVLQFRLASTTTGQLTINNGAGVVGSSAASIVAANTWYFIEITNVNIGDSDGTVTVSVNGTSVLPLTAVDLSAGTGGPFITDEWRIDTTGSGASQIFDDVTLDAVLGIYVKAWNGSTFIDVPVKVYNGSAWVDPLAVKAWSGSTWVP